METLGNFGLCLSHIAKLGYGFWDEIAREEVWIVNREFFSNFYNQILKIKTFETYWQTMLVYVRILDNGSWTLNLPIPF